MLDEGNTYLWGWKRKAGLRAGLCRPRSSERSREPSAGSSGGARGPSSSLSWGGKCSQLKPLGHKSGRGRQGRMKPSQWCHGSASPRGQAGVGWVLMGAGGQDLVQPKCLQLPPANLKGPVPSQD